MPPTFVNEILQLKTAKPQHSKMVVAFI